MSSIAIIGGTGALGGALAQRLAALGRNVWIGSRDPAKAQAAAATLVGAKGPVFGAGLAEATAQGELCILAVPYAAHGETLRQIREAAQGKIVVDATAPLKPPKVGTVQLPAAGSAAVEAAQILGDGVRVVSALQTIGAEKLASGGEIDADVLVTGDDAEAVETVRALLAELGIRSWHAGPLANSAAAEAMTSVLIQLNRRYKLAQSGVRITGRPKDAPAPAATLSVKALPGLPHFAAGDDLADAIAAAIASAGETLRDGDVLVVAQKIVSKVEGRTVALSAVTPGAAAIEAAAKADKNPGVVELIASEARELMRVAPGVIIARHRTGHVLANAGIDASNVPAGEGGESVLLWPLDPDASARGLRATLEARFGVRLGVIVSDSLGRAWRMGTTGAAIGVAGLKPLRDRRGEHDLFGRELKATVVGVADEIAAAASLVIGEAAEGTPVAIVRGATYERDDADAGVGELLRPLDKDLFR
ncbi:MAG TPA: coenzyme F420-0:L-glutamate ligase [Caulobacteraceae bacterium]|nr:coenzyme F420-0:L-glutamate ligase [Caulobacteraceae bacterium]